MPGPAVRGPQEIRAGIPATPEDAEIRQILDTCDRP
jgi:hypothetical protein